MTLAATTLSGSLAIATSGLLNIDANMAVISNNVANAGTAGYAVETQDQASAVAGSQSEGVFTGLVTRNVDLLQQSEVLSQNAVVSNLQTTQNALQPIGATQGTVGAGNDIASQLAALTTSIDTLASDPSNGAQQAAVVDAAQTLTNGINTLATAYGTARQSAQDDIVSAVGTLNQALDSIGQLNQQIVALQGGGQSTAGLENQRDAAVQTVSNLFNVQVQQNKDGSITLFTASGLAVPTPAPADAQQSPFASDGATLQPGDSTEDGTIPPITMNGVDVTSQLVGGRIGADITLRDTTIPTYQAGLDEFSEQLATRFAGEGLQLFTNPDGTIPAQTGTPTQATYVGFANSITVNPSVAADPSLVRDGTTAVTGSSTGPGPFTPNPSGGPAGFSTLVDNVLTYALGPDAQDGVAWPAIPTTGLGVDGTITASFGAPTTLSAFAAALVSGQAQDLGQASGQLTAEQAVQTTLNTQLAQTSGVNIDAELSFMLQLQNAYGANAKILAAVQAMFSALSAAVGTTTA